MSDVRILDASNYNETIASGIVIVDFYADWCGPCKMMAPIVKEAQAEYEGRAVFAKINVDENRGIATSNNIMSIPTLFFFKDGKVVDRVVGAIDKGTLRRKIDSLL